MTALNMRTVRLPARRVALLLTVLVLALAACGGGSRKGTGSAASGHPSPPAADAFYAPPNPLPPGRPGDLLRSQAWTPVPGATTSLVLYRSTDVRGGPVAVSGVVAVPAGKAAPPGGWPVLDWAHGTTGLGDDCAPSKYPAASDARLVRLIQTFVPRGYAVVATDYQGLGTPGGHPYVVGQSEGRNVLDMARAATQLAGSGVRAGSPVIVWGHSQGGGSSVFAAELQPRYAPDVALKGAVVGAPAAELRLLGAGLRTSSYFGYIFLVAAGFQNAYPGVPLQKALTPAGLDAVRVANTGCADTVIDQVRGKNPDLYLSGDPGSTPPLSDLLEQNTPGNVPTPVPMFIYQGDKDEQIPVVASQLMLARMCRTGGFTAVRKVYPGQMHEASIWAAEPDASRWMADRLAGRPAPSDC
jgi:alpha-beta hydrolase superfamily lysophospholipase